MSKYIALLLAVILLAASVLPVWADEYINLEDVPYEEVFFPPWFTTDSMPYVLEPYCIYLVYCNIFARLGVAR
jgi:hypothetical protein